ncbi:Uncharacterized phage-associated protein [Caloramator quimbayensis]|uniref:Uncharacterized phage-associated protein n=1 Tax=Caloramator quimbayensis TaxID=1147123 RepID=A0A1T4YI58_9CLOT|nr:type II toxin-antitoxin system antitoxin SocA domain-containing protein [Caloramator quimbayensis]SKB01476.1 Uncharacterized phage-associated protein [Caloramator quimbayensis]
MLRINKRNIKNFLEIKKLIYKKDNIIYLSEMIMGDAKMGGTISIFDVANYFLSKESMTHKKLQKLCYYAYAWYLTLYKEKLYNEKFEAWIHGPVNKDLYDFYKIYGWQLIPKRDVTINMDKKVKEFLDIIMMNFGNYSADALELMTHHELPWINARKGLSPSEPGFEEIKDEDIVKYYSSLLEGAQIE